MPSLASRLNANARQVAFFCRVGCLYAMNHDAPGDQFLLDLALRHGGVQPEVNNEDDRKAIIVGLKEIWPNIKGQIVNKLIRITGTWMEHSTSGRCYASGPRQEPALADEFHDDLVRLLHRP